MQEPNLSPLTLIPHPLTAEAFAAFGEVVMLSNPDRRSYFELAFEHSALAVTPSLWITYPPGVAGSEIEVIKLERHPHAAQTFIPICPGRYLVVVCHAAVDGSPDLSTLQALVALPDQAVTYRTNVWHHGLTVLDARTRFVVLTTLTGHGDDDDFYPLEQRVTVRLAEAGNGAAGGNDNA